MTHYRSRSPRKRSRDAYENTDEPGGQSSRHGGGRAAADDGRTRRRIERSRSPEDRSSRHHRRHHHRRHHHGHHRSSNKQKSSAQEPLPFNARPLRAREDLMAFLPLLARYLDVQKELYMEELSEREVKGRFKSFVKHWNEGALATAYYDPEYFAGVSQEDAGRRWRDATPPPDEEEQQQHRLVEDEEEGSRTRRRDKSEEERRGKDDDDDSDDYGPLPGMGAFGGGGGGGHGTQGPNFPLPEDLDEAAANEQQDMMDARTRLRLERKADRKDQKEKLEELAPRAEGRERKLEKKQEQRESDKRFAAAAEGGDMAEVKESDLMGDDDELAEYKRQQEKNSRRKSQRQLRREAEKRALQAEAAERKEQYLAREAKTVAGLQELARLRFGG